MRNVMELLAEMLQTLTPEDRTAAKDELIVDLVERGRANQKKLMQMLTTAVNVDLLAQGLELNDGLQGVLAKYETVVSGIPLIVKGTNLISQLNPLAEHSSTPDGEAYLSKAEGKTQAVEASLAAGAGMLISQVDREEEQDEFVQLEQRHSEAPPVPSDAFIRISKDSASSNNGVHAALTASSDASANNALVLIDPPASVKTSKEQDMIDLLSIVLCTSTASPEATRTPESAPRLHQIPVSPGRDSETSQDTLFRLFQQLCGSLGSAPESAANAVVSTSSASSTTCLYRIFISIFTSTMGSESWLWQQPKLEVQESLCFSAAQYISKSATASQATGGKPLQHFNSFQNSLFVNKQDHPTL
ncbi:TOM1-like protein [Drosera capensis]